MRYATFYMKKSYRGKIIMKTQEEYLQGLRRWLCDTADVPLEEMASFFDNRLSDYEERMSVWEKSYKLFAQLIPTE